MQNFVVSEPLKQLHKEFSELLAMVLVEFLVTVAENGCFTNFFRWSDNIRWVEHQYVNAAIQTGLKSRQKVRVHNLNLHTILLCSASCSGGCFGIFINTSGNGSKTLRAIKNSSLV